MPRTGAERKRDVLARLAQDVDAWVATSGPAGAPHLLPLSFWWDGATLLLATGGSRPTVVNVRANATAQLALGHTRDVVTLVGSVAVEEADDVPAVVADAFAHHVGWDPRTREGHVYLRVTPYEIRAWREDDEQAGRLLMRDGRWLV
jgi:hypothetical protein